METHQLPSPATNRAYSTQDLSVYAGPAWQRDPQVYKILTAQLQHTPIWSLDGGGRFNQPVLRRIVRLRHHRLRAKLQAKDTRSAKRKLKRLFGKERRFAKATNHCISKKLVAKAKDTNRAIALEDLSGIRARVTVRSKQRATWHSWAFFQLRSFVTYKALRVGVPVCLVDPRYTSRTCLLVVTLTKPIVRLNPSSPVWFAGTLAWLTTARRSTLAVGRQSTRQS